MQPEARVGSYSLGLDWIDKSEGWAVAVLVQASDTLSASLSRLPVGRESSDLVKNASRIVLDAPIGLPSGSDEGCKLRPCDDGSRKWIGPSQRSTVFAVPYEAELSEWRRRRDVQHKQKLGHFRGLLPAIHSATEIRRHHASVLESHPELCFAAMAGRHLPESASKKTLLGALVRLALLNQSGVSLPLEAVAAQGRIPTDNFIDAVAMAVIAHGWTVNGDVSIITEANGNPLSWVGQSRPTSDLMTLPAMSRDSRTATPLSANELVALACRWNG